jgi:hypothetical protein
MKRQITEKAVTASHANIGEYASMLNRMRPPIAPTSAVKNRVLATVKMTSIQPARVPPVVMIP